MREKGNEWKMCLSESHWEEYEEEVKKKNNFLDSSIHHKEKIQSTSIGKIWTKKTKKTQFSWCLFSFVFIIILNNCLQFEALKSSETFQSLMKDHQSTGTLVVLVVEEKERKENMELNERTKMKGRRMREGRWKEKRWRKEGRSTKEKG